MLIVFIKYFVYLIFIFNLICVCITMVSLQNYIIAVFKIWNRISNLNCIRNFFQIGFQPAFVRIMLFPVNSIRILGYTLKRVFKWVGRLYNLTEGDLNFKRAQFGSTERGDIYWSILHDTYIHELMHSHQACRIGQIYKDT